jgi:hypothetical protein
MTAIVQNLILPWLDAFVTALLPLLFALGLAWLRRHHLNTTFLAILGQAAGTAYQQLAQSGAKITDSVSLHAAIAAGVSYLVANLPRALQAQGITPERAAAMVAAELGRLIALDPTINVGSSPVSIPIPVPAKAPA